MDSSGKTFFKKAGKGTFFGKLRILEYLDLAPPFVKLLTVCDETISMNTSSFFLNCNKIDTRVALHCESEGANAV